MGLQILSDEAVESVHVAEPLDHGCTDQVPVARHDLLRLRVPVAVGAAEALRVVQREGSQLSVLVVVIIIIMIIIIIIITIIVIIIIIIISLQ